MQLKKIRACAIILFLGVLFGFNAIALADPITLPSSAKTDVARTTTAIISKSLVSPKLDTVKIYHCTIDGEIAPGIVYTVRKATEKAKRDGMQLILLEINTFGGGLKEAEEIRGILLKSNIPVYAFVNTNAASAGALISIACHRIYMNPESTIGSATVVNQNGEVQADKYQSYMRALMRSTAEVRGRNPEIAQAMVNSDSGKVLALTAFEALNKGYAEGVYKNINALISAIKKEITQSFASKQTITSNQTISDKENIADGSVVGDNSSHSGSSKIVFTITKQNITTSDKIINFLTMPWLSSIFIMLIIGGIYFEMQSPGIGFALGVAIVAALLYFAPLYIEGLASHWEIIIFVVGVILLAMELFVLPGFGICGISGITLICGSLTLAMLDNSGLHFNFIATGNILIALSVVIFSFIIAVPLCFFVSQRLFTRKIAGHNLSLVTEQKREDGYVAADIATMEPMVGLCATAATVLRPGGKITIDNCIYDASSESGFIEAGTPVRIVRFENTQFFVRKIEG